MVRLIFKMSSKNDIRAVLIVNNLADWITDELLYEVFYKAKFVLRVTFASAYICFRNSSYAERALEKYQHYCLHAPSINHKDCYLFIEEARNYVVSRLNDILNASPFESSNHKSCAIKVVCSAKLSLQDWAYLFPKAFDVYRSVDAHKVFFQFSNHQLALQAIQNIHHKILTLPSKLGNINVMFGCTFVKLEDVLQKIKHNVVAFEKIRSQELLCESVVEWLYA